MEDWRKTTSIWGPQGRLIISFLEGRFTENSVYYVTCTATNRSLVMLMVSASRLRGDPGWTVCPQQETWRQLLMTWHLTVLLKELEGSNLYRAPGVWKRTNRVGVSRTQDKGDAESLFLAKRKYPGIMAASRSFYEKLQRPINVNSISKDTGKGRRLEWINKNVTRHNAVALFFLYPGSY